MAGLEMRFTLNDATLLAQLDVLLERGADLQPAFDEIGQDMVSVTIRAFETSASPEGVAWLPSAAAKAEGRRTLIDRGMRGGLMGSVSYAANRDGVVYGTNMAYAAIHQFGGAIQRAGAAAVPLYLSDDRDLAASVVTLPARPYIGASDKDIRRWEGILADYVGGAAP